MSKEPQNIAGCEHICIYYFGHMNKLLYSVNTKQSNQLGARD